MNYVNEETIFLLNSLLGYGVIPTQVRLNTLIPPINGKWIQETYNGTGLPTALTYYSYGSL